MHKRPVTWTGRGLRLASIGEIVLAATAALYLLGRSGKLAAFGFLVTGFIGLLSIQRMFIGRREFGPEHARNTNWALALFFLGAFLLGYAFLSSLSTLPETLQVRDLRPPVLGVALGIICETGSGALLLWHLCGSQRRTNVAVYAALGALVGIALFAYGMIVVNLIEQGAGPSLSSAAEANVRLREFFDAYLPWVMAGFLLTRIAAWHLVGKARKEVENAEHDALAEEQAAATSGDMRAEATSATTTEPRP